MQQFIGGYEVEESLDPLLRLDSLPDLFILSLALQRSLVLNRKLNRAAVHPYGRDAVIHFCIGGRGRHLPTELEGVSDVNQPTFTTINRWKPSSTNRFHVKRY